MDSDTIHSFAKRRGFYWPSYEIYGGSSGFYDYGPMGSALLHNIVEIWRKEYIILEGMLEIDSPAVGLEDIFQASGHLGEFTDYLSTCEKCGEGYRADHLLDGKEENPDAMSQEELDSALKRHGIKCLRCGGSLGSPEPFNLMFRTTIGPGKGKIGYIRPETAQAMFVAFNNLVQQARKKLPFGVVQIGKGYRNEISPRQGLLRQREFHMAEAEVFFHPDDKNWPGKREMLETKMVLVDQHGKEHQMTAREAADMGLVCGKALAYFMALTQRFLVNVGVDPARLRFRQHLKDEMAHYASDCWDAEALLSYGWIELVGVADRGDYDLGQHIKHSGADLSVFIAYPEPRKEYRKRFVPDLKKLGPLFRKDAKEVARLIEEMEPMDGPLSIEFQGQRVEIPQDAYVVEEGEIVISGDRIVPHVIEPSYGLDRIFYTVLEQNLESGEKDGDEYRVLRLPPRVAPILVSIFPLMAKPELEDMAEKVNLLLREAGLSTSYDSSGSIGRRYARADEVGTPWCVTVDYDSLEKGDVTIRDRDTAEQVRMPVEGLADHLRSMLGQ
ncbi:MAG: glycine--tRNA ligase [Candidatus Thermoplasmatota archaeon]|nr:glycine--tRNA ligase [Candidatus Thermoplasmatota archaeon]